MNFHYKQNFQNCLLDNIKLNIKDCAYHHIAIPPAPPREPKDPCHPSPCGHNARCRAEYDRALCECLPDYHGDPYQVSTNYLFYSTY